MVTTLYLLRHGATEGSGMKRYYGTIDVALSDEGAEQIRRKADFVMEHLRHSTISRNTSYLREVHNSESDSESGLPKLAAVYCSDLQRAVRSAEIIAERIGGPGGMIPKRVPALRERNFGMWEGMTFTEIKEKYPEEFEAWSRDPLEYSPIGGESTAQVSERVGETFDEIIGRHAGENVLIVAHGGVNRIILCRILGIPLANVFRIEQDHAAVNIIEFWDKYPVVKLLNGGISL